MAQARSNPWAVLIVMCLGFFMILLDTTVVNVAIPSIAQGLGASLDGILWVLNSYILVYAVMLITAGRLGDRYGQRNLFALGMALFILASALSGVAQNTEQLIGARVLQGIGGALLTPQTLTIITSIFPPGQRGAAFGVWGAVAGVAAVTGPTLGGLIVTNWGWRWIFYINLPIGLIALVATFLIVPDLRPGRFHRLDYVGVLLATLGLLALVYSLIEGQHYQWGTISGWLSIPLLIVVGLILLAAFVAWEIRHPEPLLPFGIFRDRNFTLMNLVAAVVAFGMLGLYLPVMIYLQSVLGLNAQEAGIAVAPMPLVAMFVAPAAGRLVDRIGGKYILVVGLLLFAVGMGLVVMVATPTSTATGFILPFMLAGIGQGCTFAPMTTVAMHDVSPRMAGAASGALNTIRQLGGVVGSTAVGALLENHLANALQNEAVAHAGQVPAAFRDAFVSTIGNSARGGFDLGAQMGGSQLPAGIPPQVAQQLASVARATFDSAFVDAMRNTLVLPVVVLLIGVVLCLGVVNRPRAEKAVPAVEPAHVEPAR
ncbi:MAG: DHA2 family efflux MFS transporter permease subunit [Chloroflexota bacterium]